MSVCSQYTQLAQAITGSYRLYYAHPNPDGTQGLFNETTSYLGSVEASTLEVIKRVSSTPVYGDLFGEDEPLDRVVGPASDVITATLQEVNREAVRRLIWPWGTNTNGTTLLPGFSGEDPYPGAIASRYEGRLRMVPFSGNIRFWDNDLAVTVPGSAIRNYYRVLIDPDADVTEAFNAKLLKIPIRLIARPCYDADGNKYSTHNYVNSLLAP